jgi:hypothetical protein
MSQDKIRVVAKQRLFYFWIRNPGEVFEVPASLFSEETMAVYVEPAPEIEAPAPAPEPPTTTEPSE